MAKNIFISSALPDDAVKLVPRDFKVEVYKGTDPLPKAELIKRLVGRDGLVCQITDAIDDEVLSAAPDRKSTRLNSSHIQKSRMPSSA